MAVTRKVATTIYIRADQDAQLKMLAQRLGPGVSVAELIRRGIDLVLEDQASNLPAQLQLLPRR